MKRFLILIVLIASSYSLFAQPNFGVSFGLNLGNLKTNWEGEDPDTKIRPGFSVGAAMEYAFTDEFSLLAEANILVKGYAFDPELYGDGLSGYDKYVCAYFDIPVKAAYNLNNFRFFAGPFIDVGFWGRNKYKFEYDGEEGDEEVLRYVFGTSFDPEDIGDEEWPAYRFDGGLILGAGVKFGPVAIDASFAIGLMNITPEVEGFFDRNDMISKSRVGMITGYFYF
ncbi:MAG: PorT family protein [Bacteroidales bacterium]|nr:PorT family protein [Bacteroidales bacterium]